MPASEHQCASCGMIAPAPTVAADGICIECRAGVDHERARIEQAVLTKFGDTMIGRDVLAIVQQREGAPGGSAAATNTNLISSKIVCTRCEREAFNERGLIVHAEWCPIRRSLGWNDNCHYSPESDLQPHAYVMDVEAMGDCRVCGNVADAKIHESPLPASAETGQCLSRERITALAIEGVADRYGDDKVQLRATTQAVRRTIEGWHTRRKRVEAERDELRGRLKLERVGKDQRAELQDALIAERDEALDAMRIAHDAANTYAAENEALKADLERCRDLLCRAWLFQTPSHDNAATWNVMATFLIEKGWVSHVE